MYQSKNEGLQPLKKLRVAELRKEIAIGNRQADRGEFVDGPDVFAKIRERSAQRNSTNG